MKLDQRLKSPWVSLTALYVNMSASMALKCAYVTQHRLEKGRGKFPKQEGTKKGTYTRSSLLRGAKLSLIGSMRKSSHLQSRRDLRHMSLRNSAA